MKTTRDKMSSTESNRQPAGLMVIRTQVNWGHILTINY